jgi:hypothetical protein
MPTPIDLKTLSKEQLKNLLENARRKEREDIAIEVLRELTVRGGGKNSDYDLLEWNQESARTALAPFAEVSRTVPDNQRTTYTEAGGRKIGRSRGHPEWMWIDSYTAIKTPKLNAVFVCYVPQPGDDAYFVLVLNGVDDQVYQPSELPAALDRWRALAKEAVA